jgi:hypothetical protein
MSPIDRRAFLSALAAIPVAVFMCPAVPKQLRFIPIVYGTLSDDVMPTPPYYRALYDLRLYYQPDTWYRLTPEHFELIES